jgi:hypothetical protein
MVTDLTVTPVVGKPDTASVEGYGFAGAPVDAPVPAPGTVNAVADVNEFDVNPTTVNNAGSPWHKVVGTSDIIVKGVLAVNVTVAIAE